MADQDAKDINQMMSASAEVAVAAPKKSKFIWVVLACVILGVGLGVVVYQQSLQSTVPTVTPRPTAVVSQTPLPTAAPPVPSPVTPDVSVVAPVSNKLTFPKKGKLRIYSNLSGIQQVVRITVDGSAKTVTLPARTISNAVPMYSSDSTFEVAAGSVGTIEVFLNNTSGLKMRGWVNATDQKKCGANGFAVIDLEPQLAFVQSKLAGQSIFSYQCWEDDDDPGEFNDMYMLWTYAPDSAVSPSPSASVTPTTSPSPSASATTTPKPSATATPTPTPTPAATATPTPASSPRVTMPDTSEGTPVSGVFEITVGTISIGILLLILGLFGLLAL